MSEGGTLPSRDPRGHKGTFGSVLVVGGQASAPRIMLGGPAFSALGALRSGAGLAILAVPAPLMPHALSIAPSATGLALPTDGNDAVVPDGAAALIGAALDRVHALALGPGLGTPAGVSGPTTQLVRALAVADGPPTVVDADALNAVAVLAEATALPDAPWNGRWIVTPHPGEYRRLAEALGLTGDPLSDEGRPDAAQALARRLGAVVVLKGHRTVVADESRSWTASVGNAALATGGSGDVLTGVIAGVVAQFARPSLERPLDLHACARLGVQIHGVAADRWAARHGTAGMLATDLLDAIPDALRAVRDERD